MTSPIYKYQKFQFPLILATAFFDILGIAILLPILPFLIKNFGMSGAWVGYTMVFYSIGMFLGGFIFGRMSDKYGRRSMLVITSICNIFGYLTVIFAPYLGWFVLFVIGRFVAGLAGSGISVTQAYVSDISSKENRTKQMGMIGAMFGLGFLVGPAIGGSIALISYTAVGIAGMVAATINLLLILLFLPEPKKHIQTDGLHLVPGKRTKLMMTLFILSFFVTVAFSPIQAISSQYNVDRFQFDAQHIAYVLIIIGLTSVLYQGFLIKYIRAYFQEISMIHLGLAILVVGFFLNAYNSESFWLWFILPLFSIGMGAVQPSISSLIAQDAGSSAGKYLGMNNSYMSLGNIFGPGIAGLLYEKSITLPFYVSSAIFAAILLTTYFLFLDMPRKVEAAVSE